MSMSTTQACCELWCNRKINMWRGHSYQECSELKRMFEESMLDVGMPKARFKSIDWYEKIMLDACISEYTVNMPTSKLNTFHTFNLFWTSFKVHLSDSFNHFKYIPHTTHHTHSICIPGRVSHSNVEYILKFETSFFVIEKENVIITHQNKGIK